MADVGWVGSWEPLVVTEKALEELRDLAGQPVLNKRGTPEQWCLVNLRTGDFRYPARG
jgi:hypothetical protein